VRDANHLEMGREVAEQPQPLAQMPLTKYERTHVLSRRAAQLASGAEPLVAVARSAGLDPLAIALQELQQGRLRATRLVRTMPSGERSVHALHDVDAIHDSCRADIRKWTSSTFP